MNYDEHILAGLVTFPIAIAMALSLEMKVGVPMSHSFRAMATAYAFYVLGSDLPDLDHPQSLIHRIIKPFLAAGVGAIAYKNITQYVNFFADPLLNIVLAWVIATGVTVGVWYAFPHLLPTHRGIMHSVLASGVYGVLVYLITKVGLGFTHPESVFVALIALVGYNVHLATDGVVKVY